MTNHLTPAEAVTEEWSYYAHDLDKVASAQDLASFIETMFDDLARTRQDLGGYGHGLSMILENGAEFEIAIVRRKAPKFQPCEDCGAMTDDLICDDCDQEQEETTMLRIQKQLTELLERN
jgi:hypothetical protein